MMIDLPGTNGENESVANRVEETHGGGVDGPRFHHGKIGITHLSRWLIETGKFVILSSVGLDLSDSGNVIVKHGIHFSSGFADNPVTFAGVTCI